MMDAYNAYVNARLWQWEQTELIKRADRQRVLAEFKQTRQNARQSKSTGKPAQCEPKLVKESL